MGYQAVASLNGTALSIPMAEQAGLGEAGRNGLLITPDRGPCVRLAKVFTDMPALVSSPSDAGIRAYCRTCDACARACPAQAISYGPPTREPRNECNRADVIKWQVDAKRCLRYWISSGTSCSACIAACPFTLGKRWGWGLPQRLIRRTTRLNRVLAWLDRRYERRKHRPSSHFLEETPLPTAAR
jgi:epoxyqueuosine reductase QueG